jgi:hypothetical protein
MTQPPPIAQALPQFSEENLRQLATARTASRKIRRAVSVANFDGWSIAIFGALSIGFGLGDVSSMAIGVLLGAIAFVELRSAAQLKRLKVEATRTLAWNQVAFATLLIVYAVWRLYATSRPGAISSQLGLDDPQVASMLAPAEDLTRLLMRAIYGGLIAVAVFFQGGLAWYYHTRARMLRKYLADTPPWILTLQEQGVAL